MIHNTQFIECFQISGNLLRTFSKPFELQLDCFSCNTPRQHCWDPNMKQSRKWPETCCGGEFVLSKLHENTKLSNFNQCFLNVFPSQVLCKMDPAASIEPGNWWEGWWSWFSFSSKNMWIIMESLRLVFTINGSCLRQLCFEEMPRSETVETYIRIPAFEVILFKLMNLDESGYSKVISYPKYIQLVLGEVWLTCLSHCRPQQPPKVWSVLAVPTSPKSATWPGPRWQTEALQLLWVPSQV